MQEVSRTSADLYLSSMPSLNKKKSLKNRNKKSSLRTEMDKGGYIYIE